MTEVPGEDLPGRVTPAGVSDETVDALGKLSEALEACERARGHLYEFHQLTGSADIALARSHVSSASDSFPSASTVSSLTPAGVTRPGRSSPRTSVTVLRRG